MGSSLTERHMTEDLAFVTIALQGMSEATDVKCMHDRNNRTRRNIAFASPNPSRECSCARKHGSGIGDGCGRLGSG